MSKRRIVSVVLFVLGIVLISVGMVLSNVSQANITLMGRLTTYPYLGAGVAVIVLGTVTLVVAYTVILFKSFKQ